MCCLIYRHVVVSDVRFRWFAHVRSSDAMREDGASVALKIANCLISATEAMIKPNLRVSHWELIYEDFV